MTPNTQGVPERIAVEFSREEAEVAKAALEAVDLLDAETRHYGLRRVQAIPTEVGNRAWAKLRSALALNHTQTDTEEQS